MRNLLRAFAVASVLLVAGCSGGGAGESSDAAVEESDGALDAGAEGGGAEAPAQPEAVDDQGGQQSFVVHGSLSMVVEEPAQSATQAARLVEAVGGHVQERVEEGGAEDELASAYLVVRIPAAEVTETLEEIRALGDVVDSSQVTEEVTDRVRDLDARIRALEISIGRLEALLERAGTIPEVVEAEQVLTERQSELEVLLSQQASLADDVALSTFRIDMWREGTEPDEPPTGFLAGLADGWNALVVALTGLLQALGAVLPWLLFFALVAAVVVAVRRALVGRRTSTATSSVPEQPLPRPVPATAAAGPAAGPTTSLPVVAPAAEPQPTTSGPAEPLPGEAGVTPEPSPAAEPKRGARRRRPPEGAGDS